MRLIVNKVIFPNCFKMSSVTAFEKKCAIFLWKSLPYLHAIRHKFAPKYLNNCLLKILLQIW